MEYLSIIVPLIFSVISLGSFLTGITLAVFELSDVLPAVISTFLGLVGLFVSAALKNEPHFPKFAGGNREKTLELLPENIHLITPDTTETLMKSIKGIPYLIQAIQYSLEASYYSNMMSEMGHAVLGNSVIHTAPGCPSALNCDSDEDNIQVPLQTPSPRYSGPEEQWEATETNRWSNHQLRLSMNRRTSSLLVSVFPYSESRPVEESIHGSRNGSLKGSVAVNSERGSLIEGDYGASMGSQQSHLSRVTVSHTSLPSREIRCIGMSPALLTRFNSSFKSNAGPENV
ncbi:hypothetical protein FO519_007647 [Halicephalobus sp. NKZ332]|nr:hypothetical protein FO519_007647 [Halicephalobus sp. NKZ332]